MELENLSSLRARYRSLTTEIDSLDATRGVKLDFEYARLRQQKRQLALVIARLENALVPDGAA